MGKSNFKTGFSGEPSLESIKITNSPNLFSIISKIPCFISSPYASMVEMVRVVSSRTSSRTFTVSSAVNTVTLFSTAH